MGSCAHQKAKKNKPRNQTPNRKTFPADVKWEPFQPHSPAATKARKLERPDSRVTLRDSLLYLRCWLDEGAISFLVLWEGKKRVLTLELGGVTK